MRNVPEIAVQLSTHPRFGLLLLPLHVGDTTLYMFVSGSPVSGVAAHRWQDLLMEEHLIYPEAPGAPHVLDHLSIAGIPVPRLAVRPSLRASRFEVDGELGLNFFQLFAEACFHMPDQPGTPILLTIRAGAA